MAISRVCFPGIEVNPVRPFVYFTFPDDANSKEEENRILWNAMVNRTLPPIHEKDGNKVIGCYTLTKELVVE